MEREQFADTRVRFEDKHDILELMKGCTSVTLIELKKNVYYSVVGTSAAALLKSCWIYFNNRLETYYINLKYESINLISEVLI